MGIKFPKIENHLSGFSNDITGVIIKTKKLPPPGEATHSTIKISYLDNFQNLVSPILFRI